MLRSTLALSLLLSAACSGGGVLYPPRGPAYTPENTPEAATACPEARSQAQTAREALLDDTSETARRSAAHAVFAHAECEAEAFRAARLAAPSQDVLLDQIRAARETYWSAANLYREVVRYGADNERRAGVRLGDLHLAFAEALRAIEPPRDLFDEMAREDFRQDIETLAREIEVDAIGAYAQALAVPERTRTRADWLVAACQRLETLHPQATSDAGACH